MKLLIIFFQLRAKEKREKLSLMESDTEHVEVVTLKGDHSIL